MKDTKKEIMKCLKGAYDIKLYGPDGQLNDRRTADNLTVNEGYIAVLKQMLWTGNQPAAFGFTAVGSSAVSAPATTDVALESQIEDRHAAGFSTISIVSSKTDATWAAGHATGAIRESGIFNDASAGQMLARQTFAVINKGASDTLIVTWTYTLS